MASATVLGYGSIPGSRNGSRPQSPALNVTNGMDKSALRTASPYSYTLDKDRERSGLSSYAIEQPGSSALRDVERTADRNGEPDIDSVSNGSGSRRGSFDFQAILKKYNIRLDDDDEQDKRLNNGSAHQSRPQTPQLADSANLDASHRVSQSPSATSLTASKFDLGKYDYAARGSEPLKDTDAYNSPQIRTPLVPKRTTPLSFGTGATPSSASNNGNYPTLTPSYVSSDSQMNLTATLTSAVPSLSLNTDSNAVASAHARVSVPVSSSGHVDDSHSLRRQLAERDAECATVKRQLEEERDRVRRTQSDLAAARATVAQQRVPQTDPALTAKSIELETMRSRYEELLADKSSLEDTVERLQRDLEAASVRNAAQAPSVPRRRYDDESSSDEQDAQRPVPHLNLYDPNGPEALKRKISELESHVHDLQEANEAAALALQSRERELAELKRDHQRQSHSSVPQSSVSNSAGQANDAWKREADGLRDRNRTLVEENGTLREQLLAAKKVSAATASASSSSASASADSLRYYQSQLADARETIRKLQEQLFASSQSAASRLTAPAAASASSASAAPARSSSPSVYLRGSEARVPAQHANESDADADADAEQSDSNSTNVLLNAASRVPFSLADFGDKDFQLSSDKSAARSSAVLASSSASQFDVSKYDSLARKYDRPISPTRTAVSSSAYGTAASAMSPAPITSSKSPSFTSTSALNSTSDLYKRSTDDYASRMGLNLGLDRDRDRDRDYSSSNKVDAERERSRLKTEYQSRSLRSSPVVVSSSWNSAAAPHTMADAATGMRASAFDLHSNSPAIGSNSRFSAMAASNSATSPSAFRSPFSSSKDPSPDRSRSSLITSHKAPNDSLLSDSDGEAQSKLSAAAITANISRLLDKVSAPQHVSGRASVPVKATLPVSMATAEKDRLHSTSNYHDVLDSRRNRPTASDLLNRSVPPSSTLSQSRYSSLLSSTVADRNPVSASPAPNNSAYRSTLSSSALDNSPDRRSRPYAPRTPNDVRMGDSVKFCRQGGHVSKGRVMYVGPLPGRGDTYLGVELESEDGKHDGIYEGSRYFKCKPNKGVFVAFSKVILVY